ncbi:ABC transporter [Nocardiopsis sp. CT-R113]|uniref:ABC transporter n=1 Tax=Nocardiopsis codii TaxID=3065942 RepID=A0ABU7KE76_9ACTN|nr:ABC transporter [Nocardiopsis sp. CT-R113]MEE2039897.1 ABC transporter [Nocardiopsis sp. CT-R113]
MIRPHRRSAAPRVSAGLLAMALLAGCAPAPDPSREPEEDEATPHGYVEGAEETAEPQSRLVIADTEGPVQVLDLITGESTLLDPVGTVDGITGDGRFAHLISSDERMTTVIDSGTWTVDHGDHVHYYRAAIRPAGTVEGIAAENAATDTALTALTDGEGGVSLLDRPSLEDGTVDPVDPSPAGTDATVVAPYGGAVVTAAADGVRVNDRSGERIRDLGGECTAPRDQATTRRGLVIGCDEGAFLVTEDDGEFTGELLPHPDGLPADARPDGFHHRPGAAALATVPAPDTVLALDLAEPRWDHWELPGVVSVAAIGEGASVLALTEDGTLHSFDPETGEETAATALLDRVDTDDPPAIRVDTSRAYVNDVHGGLVHEIDYNDDLRVARTFETEVAPRHMVETGR